MVGRAGAGRLAGPTAAGLGAVAPAAARAAAATRVVVPAVAAPAAACVADSAVGQQADESVHSRRGTSPAGGDPPARAGSPVGTAPVVGARARPQGAPAAAVGARRRAGTRPATPVAGWGSTVPARESPAEVAGARQPCSPPTQATRPRRRLADMLGGTRATSRRAAVEGTRRTSSSSTSLPACSSTEAGVVVGSVLRGEGVPQLVRRMAAAARSAPSRGARSPSARRRPAGWTQASSAAGKQTGARPGDTAEEEAEGNPSGRVRCSARSRTRRVCARRRGGAGAAGWDGTAERKQDSHRGLRDALLALHFLGHFNQEATAIEKRDYFSAGGIWNLSQRRRIKFYGNQGFVVQWRRCAIGIDARKTCQGPR